MTIRSPAVAGTFYPATPDALDRAVRAALAAAHVDVVPAKAIVAPHAGYLYSGLIAGSAFQSVGDRRITRVVLLGPSHRMYFSGIAVPSASGLATPLGPVPIDRAAVDLALGLPDVHLLDAAFDNEHALEVELPFIQVRFPQAAIVPLIVGEVSAEAVENVLAELWGGEETLIVVSSDLSHYHDYAAARALDLGTSQAIEVGGKVTADGACGHRALAGLLRRAQKLDLRATTRDLRNSGDTSGPRDRVVGYGAYTFEYAQAACLAETQRQELLDVAHATLRQITSERCAPEPDVANYALPLRAVRATFVTLETDGQLRGCVGTLTPAAPLISDVVVNTFKAARQDRRFTPMTDAELTQARVTISILGHMRPLAFASEAELLAQLRPGIDGLALDDGERRALFLPKVWSELPDPREFLLRLKQKAEMPPQEMRGARAFRFTTETFSGPMR